jgi:hypothetical protein
MFNNEIGQIMKGLILYMMQHVPFAEFESHHLDHPLLETETKSHFKCWHHHSVG